MKIYKHGVPYTNISISQFYAVSYASRAPSLLFMKTAFYALYVRNSTCYKINLIQNVSLCCLLASGQLSPKFSGFFGKFSKPADRS